MKKGSLLFVDVNISEEICLHVFQYFGSHATTKKQHRDQVYDLNYASYSAALSGHTPELPLVPGCLGPLEEGGQTIHVVIHCGGWMKSAEREKRKEERNKNE